MPRRSKGSYPNDWPELAAAVKAGRVDHQPVEGLDGLVVVAVLVGRW